MTSVLTSHRRRATPPSRRRRRRQPSWLLPAAAVVVLAGLTIIAARTLNEHRGIPAPSVAVGTVVDDQIPDIALIGSDGRPTSLASMRGKTVVVADFMTSCQEECPITTGALESLRRDIAAAGLGAQVAIVEVSIDPARDTPARLRAYARRTGVGMTFLTGTPANLAALWRFFGIYVQKVAESRPPNIDWQTGRPYTYDIAHQDGVFFLSPNGHERFVIGGDANVGGVLPAPLAAMLDQVGRSKLRAAQPDTWTVPQVLQVLHWMTGRKV